jgi:hypothetical protein
LFELQLWAFNLTSKLVFFCCWIFLAHQKPEELIKRVFLGFSLFSQKLAFQLFKNQSNNLVVCFSFELLTDRSHKTETNMPLTM